MGRVNDKRNDAQRKKFGHVLKNNKKKTNGIDKIR